MMSASLYLQVETSTSGSLDMGLKVGSTAKNRSASASTTLLTIYSKAFSFGYDFGLIFTPFVHGAHLPLTLLKYGRGAVSWPSRKV